MGQPVVEPILTVFSDNPSGCYRNTDNGRFLNETNKTENLERMQVGLFIPCYIDQFYPQVGLATVSVLREHGCEVEFPEAQTCCGQPMANTGCSDATAPLAHRFVEIFESFPYVVCPSGSCVAMVRHHYAEYFRDDTDRLNALRDKTFELCEFLTDVLKVTSIGKPFPHRVGIHQSCHGLRELGLGSPTELMKDSANKLRQLLETMSDVEITQLQRPDECCGFGGTFAVAEEAVSCLMGQDRIEDHERAGTEVLTAGDMSCLMHMQGLISRQRKPIHVMHIAEILAGHDIPQLSHR